MPGATEITASFRSRGESPCLIPPRAARRPRAPVVLAFAAVYVLWGSTYLAIRVGVETIPPFLMAGDRHLTAGVLLLAWLRLSGTAAPTRRHWRSAAIIGGLMLLGGNGLVTWAERRVPSGLAALIVASVPIWMTLLHGLPEPAAAARHRPPGAGARPGRPRVLSRARASRGSRGPRRSAGGGGSSERGPVLGHRLAVFAKGAAALLDSPGDGDGDDRGRPDPARDVHGRRGMAEFSFAAVSGRSLFALGYLVVAGSLLGFTAYVFLLGATTPARVSTYAYVNPVVAMFLGWILAGEVVTHSRRSWPRRSSWRPSRPIIRHDTRRASTARKENVTPLRAAARGPPAPMREIRGSRGEAAVPPMTDPESNSLVLGAAR